MQNHFNSSLSPVQKWKSNEIVKAKIRLTVSFTMTNGGFHSRWSATAIIVRVGDIEKVHSHARQHASLRDFMLLHLPYENGLRTGEINTLKAEYINFEEGTFYVFDSKQKALCGYPIPLRMVTLQLLDDLLGGKRQGYVFTRSQSWKYVKEGQPLTIQEVWHIIRNLGLEAGVEGLKPRHLREYFAYNWACVEEKNLVTLQLILRHESLETTQIYVNKLYPWEKMRQDFDAKRNHPFIHEGICQVPDGICRDCSIVQTCRFAPLPECVDSCRYKPKVEVEQK